MNRTLHLLLALMLMPAWTGPAGAHDGGFGHSRRTIFVSAEARQLIIEYRITPNPDEALIEMTQIDRDRDGGISQEEKDRYFQARAKQLAEKLQARTGDNATIPLTFVSYELKHPLVQVFRFTAATEAGEVLLDDQNFPHKPGLIRIHAGVGVTVEQVKPVDLNHAERLSLKISRTGAKR